MDINLFRRRHLPHWDVVGGTYFVTACLEGSIPAQGLLDLKTFDAELERQPRRDGMSDAEWLTHCWKLQFARREQWLDLHPAVRHLSEPRLAQEVVDALCFFAGERYDLIAYVVMPSHFHWLFRPLESWVAALKAGPPTPRERIMHSVKRHTARRCNELLGLQGALWQEESFDHWVRNDEELLRIVEYIEMNPVKASP